MANWEYETSPVSGMNEGAALMAWTCRPKISGPNDPYKYVVVAAWVSGEKLLCAILSPSGGASIALFSDLEFHPGGPGKEQ